MKNESNQPRESLWRTISQGERAKLRGEPELELEARLTDALGRLPEAPVPSNFTSRVLNAIELEEKQAARSHGWIWNWHALLPRMAVATAILVVAGVSFQRYEVGAQRLALVKNVAQVASAQPMPSADVLENLDAIQRMSQSGHADNDLLVALQ